MERKQGIAIAQRGRPKALHPVRTEYGKAIRKDYEAHRIDEKRRNIQQYEPRMDGRTNTITTILKDNLILARVEKMENERPTDANGKTLNDYLFEDKDGNQYGIFKLTPRECGRLMGVTDNDIDKMMEVNSNTQCFKQFGNSICTTVLVALFSQLNIAGCPVWNKATENERQAIVSDTTGVYSK